MWQCLNCGEEYEDLWCPNCGVDRGKESIEDEFEDD